MRLLYLIPGVMHSTKLGTEEMERRRRILQEHAFPGTEVDVCDTDNGPSSIESICEEYQSIPDTINKAVEAQKNGYDGIMLGCFADPGIDALREMLTIPVVGPFESSAYTALTLGHRFSIITGNSDLIPVLEEEVLAKGVAGHRLASVRAIDIDVLNMFDDPELLRRRTLDTAITCIKEDRADTLVLGCVSLAFSGMDEVIEKELQIPCVNPILTALKMCEGYVSNKTRHSKKAYPLPLKLRKPEIQ
jgi:allantoin racemase